MDEDRRRLLAAGAVPLCLVAGCLGGPDAGSGDGERGDDGDDEGDGGSDAGDGPAGTTRERTDTASADGTTDGTASADPTTTGSGEDLDLREANVTAVVVERDGEGYRFDVTLYHDDDGEDGYANWWQVETYDGERLGRRDLLHAHGTREFTRSTTVTLPAGTRCVVVRGHDETHGYGGRAMLVDVETGRTEPLDQGPEPTAPVDAPCPPGDGG